MGFYSAVVSVVGIAAAFYLEIWVQGAAGPAEKHLQRFRFVDVREIMISTKPAELLRSKIIGGNVTQGWLSDSDVLDLSIYTTGGYMRIVARDVERRDHFSQGMSCGLLKFGGSGDDYAT